MEPGGAQCQARHAGGGKTGVCLSHAVQRQPQRLLVVQGGADGQRHAAQRLRPSARSVLLNRSRPEMLPPRACSRPAQSLENLGG